MPPSQSSPVIDPVPRQQRSSGPSYTPITPILVGEGAAPEAIAPHGDQPSQRELELELVRLRAAAEAAWLDARAAEIELLLRKMHRQSTQSLVTQATAFEAAALLNPASAIPQPLLPETFPSGWELFGAAAADALAIVSDFPPLRIEPDPTEAPTLDLTASEKAVPEPLLPAADLQPPITTESFAKNLSENPGETAASAKAANGFRIGSKFEADLFAATGSEKTQASISRRRPAAFVVSLVAHIAVIVLLALLTVSVHVPKDAMSLQASAAEAEQEDIQAVELQPSEAPEVASESSLAVAAEAPSDARELVPTEVNIGDLAAPPAVVPPGSLAAMAADGANLSQSLTGDVSTQFFGVSGGGNHFVYLVDSSRSMDDVSRDGFEVARSEVIRAVEQLKPEQRFYVVFFGEQTWSMRLSNPAVDEPTSVYATDENKAALRRWAMTLQMQPGTWPKEALEIAFRLRPDCIFLLTDGEMSQNVIPLIKEQNIVDTLFDGPKPRSIIHTIGFHSPTGETRLREIAKLSNGTYRFVPATGNGRR